VGRAGIEPATICDQRLLGACQADILTSLASTRSKLDDRPIGAVNGFGQHKDSSRTAAMRSLGPGCVFSSDESDSVDVLVLPGVASNLGRLTKTTRGTSLLSDVIGMTAAPAASDVGLRSAPQPERGRALSHFHSPASAKLNGYLCQPLSASHRSGASGWEAGLPVRRCRL